MYGMYNTAKKCGVVPVAHNDVRDIVGTELDKELDRSSMSLFWTQTKQVLQYKSTILVLGRKNTVLPAKMSISNIQLRSSKQNVRAVWLENLYYRF